VAGIAAVATTSFIVVVLLAMFEHQAAMPWLPPTEENIERMSICNGVQGSAAREACARDVVASVLSGSSAPIVALTGGERPTSR
jgi:hypothetical protein